MIAVRLNIFDDESVRKATQDVENYREVFAKQIKEILRRVAIIGADMASASYADGESEGNDRVRVTVKEMENGCAVIAEGEDVYFLEFGTGVAAGAGYDTSVITPPVDISSGSWSRTKGTGEFEKYGSWHHDGQKYTLTIPRKGMYFAVKEAQRRCNEVAEEVFDS